MKKVTMILTCVVALAIICVSFAGCSLVKDMDDINAYKQRQENIKKAEEQMAQTVMTLNGDIAISGGYFGYFFSKEYNSQYQLAADALKASSSADSSAVPEVDAELVMANAQKAIAEVKLPYLKAVEAGIELTKQDKDVIKQQLNALKSQAAQQGANFTDTLYLMSTNETYLNQILEEEFLGNKYFASLMADSYATTKHIFVSFEDSEKTKDEAIAMAKEIKKELDAGADFDKLINEKIQDAKDTDGILVNKDGITISLLSEQSNSYVDAALELAEGEISDVIVDDTINGCYIIKKLPLNLSDVAYGLFADETEPIESIFVSTELDAITEGAKFETTDKINYYTENLYKAN